MRKCKVFVGSSHPELGQLVCERLGVEPAPCTLKKFSNGETSVQIGVSVRDEDVYIIQSGSPHINDHIMELLILISACRGGSANKITAVIPQFPYSKQSKMKKHRGAITARMLANLLVMAGADHVVSMDLHASQMQGFFTKPVDNLFGAPTLARWIRHNIPDWENSVVVSKNPGGTKRVTALADSLKINFAMIHTDRRRTQDEYARKKALKKAKIIDEDGVDSNGKDNIVNELQTARIVQGHVVDDDYQCKSANCKKGEVADENSVLCDSNGTHLTKHNIVDSDVLGGSYDVANSDDEDDGPLVEEKLITLVGDVKDKVAIILDDMIDKPNSFIAAAEHLRLNCGAKAVYVVGTHGVFNDTCLDALTDSKCIDKIVVTNTYPIPKEEIEAHKDKLVVIDVSPIFAECIRRDHFGESISVLFDSLAAVE
ncbi:ribose-phosphate pyrophosphokinase 1 [Lodderomyces elongisporus]|uniref:Ribose-phosphate pyrophosphokinase 1 n=1 Tax=Lodderomyces elongisporus (strain ATCC 11503 / CBS 2605 / JCM 1781 / NBRC 1676 / NRRL YB-4239) TaxID=379508 RepID=A5E252_LODEL|nr:ribose-phosphate pyrophosphokinase 1 [Lodderomyces elongisporus]EDK45510.1 ribose-phosphate pyrophosphokinase 1 [Lodderomyces elongisporus NRRL YB-4239]WLF80729.1 ribose-phosphate pyrophosphokinase 1 [Lodderomyces elongisporus]